MKIRSKIFVSIMLIVSMLFSLNSVYAERNDQELSLRNVTTERAGVQAFNQLLSDNSLSFFSNKNKYELQINLKAISYVKEQNSFVFYFEKVVDESNGWFVSVVYDKSNRKIIDGISGDIVNNQSVVRVFEGKTHYLNKEKTNELRGCDDCNHKKAKSPKKASILSGLVFDQKVDAAKTCTPEKASKQCGWTSVVICAVATGIPIIGWVGGLVCSAVSQYVCSEVPLSGCI